MHLPCNVFSENTLNESLGTFEMLKFFLLQSVTFSWVASGLIFKILSNKPNN